MKVLVVFLLSVLGCSLAEARLVTKCELFRAFNNLPDIVKQHVLPPTFVAKIVCHVELAGFNTSSVILLTADSSREDHSWEKKNRDSDGGSSSSSGSAEARESNTRKWRGYGLFQLSDHLVCRDGITPSANICNMACNDFIDDNISDDLECVSKISTDLIEHGFGSAYHSRIMQWVRLILKEEECETITPAYFNECVQP